MSNISKLSWAWFACLALSSGIAGAAEPVRSGRHLAEQKCAGCHAIGADGSSTNLNAPPLRTLFTRYPIDALRESFAKGIEVGHRDMPRFILSATEIDHLLVYLRSLADCGKPSSDVAAMASCFKPMP